MTDVAPPRSGAELPPALDDSVIGTPARRPDSVRRTASIDMVWPDGLGTPLNLVGRSRDLLTTPDDEPVVLGEAEMLVTIGPNRTVASIAVVPERPGIERLVGTQGGSRLRGAIDEVLPGEREAATPLHLLLDDIAGTSLIAGFVWFRWLDGPPLPPTAPTTAGAAPPPMGIRNGRIICSGLRPGGTAQLDREHGRGQTHAVRPAGDISTPDDPWGWHEWPDTPPMRMRRHRRVDVWREGGSLMVDAFFRDSCWDPDGSQNALHEYTVEAAVDPATQTLVSVHAQPRVLPFPECQWAAPHVDHLTGMPVAGFRTSVQETLTELQCCTHLNDMLRCLAEVPSLARALAAT
jgi:Protein of unknown function (DUF2889)